MSLHPWIDAGGQCRLDARGMRGYWATRLACRMLVLALLGLPVACAPGADPLRPPAMTATPYVSPTHEPAILASAPGSPSLSTPTAALAQAGSPFRRWEPPAFGVNAQLGVLSVESPSGCQVYVDVGPGVKPISGVGYPSMCDAIEASTVTLSFHEFSARQPLDVEVTRPDGVTRSFQLDTVARQLAWPVLPGDPLGVYRVTAVQGSSQGSGLFRVQPAQAGVTRLLVTPASVTPGQNVVVALAGFPPAQRVTARLYRRLGAGHWYVAELPRLQADDRGGAQLSLPTDPGDTPAEYLILTDPPVNPKLAASRFSVGDPPPDIASIINPPVAEVPEALIRLVIDDAARVWSEVVAGPELPVGSLARVYQGTAFVDASATVRQQRAVGQRRSARLLEPIKIVSVRPIGRAQFEVTTLERWDDRVYDRDGRETLVYPSRREERYVVAWVSGFLRPGDTPPPPEACPGDCWLVISHVSLRSQ